MSQLYEYLIVTTDHKSMRIVADSIKGVLDAIDEEETPILNIFRNVPISEGSRSLPATIKAEVFPAVAAATGCAAYPTMPVETYQGKAIVLSAVVKPGWQFDGWYVDKKLVATSLQASFINEEAGEVVYTAKFSPKV